jgi:virulence-associated protein VapD
LTSIFARSRFDPKFGTVYINKVHPDYSRKVLKAKTELEQLDYYYKLAIKEIVLHQYDGAPRTCWRSCSTCNLRWKKPHPRFETM